MSIFGAYVAKYCNAGQYQLSHLSYLREGALEMYKKVRADSRVPQLEKDLEEAWLKWANLAKEHAALAVKVKQVPKLEAEVEELKQTIAKLCNVH